MTDIITILGIESSCDDTAAAVVQRINGKALVLSSVVVGQEILHEAYGGVVPEIAARAHAEQLDIAVEKALVQSDIKLEHVDAIAVTSGPGLKDGVKLEAGHVVSHKNGGKASMENLITQCNICNSGQSSRNIKKEALA